ncbi:3-ketosphinganine reductase [Zalerion maritima]|uniref:3-dehydrosphinganine reductase n=1 Tax=Zalerion maritima TaxID=339359 RepID=A0AAD5WUS6_9PEZI|nr:3-ketosphinganine reductase [Zalerion maritima]
MELASKPAYLALAAVGATLLATTMGMFSKNQMPVEGKTILITGGSDGMGLSVSRQLAAKGANIIIVARNVGKLEEAIVTLKASAKNPESQRFTYISADVSEHNYAAAVIAEAIAWNNGKSPDIVWCIAGVATPDFWVDTPLEVSRRNMDINYWGNAEMSHAVLREWLDPSAPVTDEPKHFIFTSSVVAFYSIAGYSPYAPAKIAIRTLADTLAQEVKLYPQNVEIHVVYPGTILTAGLETENKSKPEITHILEEDDPQQSADTVARRAINGLERGEYFVTVAWLGHLMKWGMMGGSPRNNWLIDTLMQFVVALVWLIVYPIINSKLLSYAKKHGHPATYKLKNANTKR